MREYSEVVEWPEEIRRLIIAKIEELKRIRAVEEAVKLLEQISPAPKGTAGNLVREDRERHRCINPDEINPEGGGVGGGR